jgi:hypothetical protein
MMLGVVLARAGVPVTVLEKHDDVLRDVRGDTVHASTLTRGCCGRCGACRPIPAYVVAMGVLPGHAPSFARRASTTLDARRSRAVHRRAAVAPYRRGSDDSGAPRRS